MISSSNERIRPLGQIDDESRSISARVKSQSKESNNKDLIQQSGFTVIWHNLTYRVDSRPWITKAKERIFPGSRQDLIVNVDEGGNFSEVNNVSPREKIILNHISGNVESRQLTAIMGPSGAGKSTLLHCLFQNRTAGVTGQILVDSRSNSKLKVCFIPQHDYLNEWLTVREDLMFVSKLKSARINGLFEEESSNSTTHQSDNSNGDYGKPETKNNSYVRQAGKDCNTSLIDHEANALRVSGLLGLNNCLDVMIKNISGGQKKRLSIARELMSKPDVLILDEPTTGLDSLTCYKTITVLKDLTRLSKNPMAVVVTIHQPQREVFNLFDKAYMISNKGQVVYDGNPRSAGEIVEKVSGLKSPTPKYNPASFLIDIASDDSQPKARELLSRYHLGEFYKKFDETHLKRLIKLKSGVQNWNFCTVEEGTSIYSGGSSAIRSSNTPGLSAIDTDAMNQPNDDHTVVKEITNNDTSSNGVRSLTEHYFISHQLSDCLSSHSNNLLQSFKHIFILTHRSWLSVIRNPSFTRSRLAFHMLLPMMMLVVFGNSMGKPNACPKIETELNFHDMKSNIENGVISRNIEETRLSIENMSFYFIQIYGFAINIISCTASFYPLTMHMFKKETINGLYTPGPYFIGQMLAEIPLEIFFPSLSVILSYQLSGQISSFMGWRMFAISYIVVIVTYSIHALGLLSGSIFVNNVSVSVLFGQVLLLPFIMLSGFLIRPTRMPDWMLKLSYTSPFKHAMMGIMASRYGFNVCGCEEDMIPLEGENIELSGMTPQVKRVIEYMFPKNSTDGTIGNGIPITDVFQKLGQKFVKAQTFALDIKSCDDVKPYIMHVFDVYDSTLLYSILYVMAFIIIVKTATFSIMRSFPYRIN